MPDGSLLLGTGNEGKILRVTGGQVDGRCRHRADGRQLDRHRLGRRRHRRHLARRQALEVAEGQGKGVDGQAVRRRSTGRRARLERRLRRQEPRSLYAATGPEGKLFRIDQAGRGAGLLRRAEPHLMCVARRRRRHRLRGRERQGPAVQGHGAGPRQRALRLRRRRREGHRRRPRRAKCSPSPTSTARPSRPRSAQAPAPPAPQPARHDAGRARACCTLRHRRHRRAAARRRRRALHLLALGDDGRPYVGTGVEGRVYTVDAGHLGARRRRRRAPDRRGRRWPARSASSSRAIRWSCHAVKGEGGPDAVWTSKVLDAGLRARFGQLSWRRDGRARAVDPHRQHRRAGRHLERVDAGLTAPGEVTSPVGRYVQVRARLRRDPNAVLNQVDVALRDRQRARHRHLDRGRRRGQRRRKTGDRRPPGGEIAEAAEHDPRSAWKIDNPDKDELRYRLQYRLEGQRLVRLAQAGREAHQGRLRAGRRLAARGPLPRPGRGHATRSPTRPIARTRHTRESAPCWSTTRRRSSRPWRSPAAGSPARCVDGVGPIARIEVSVAGSDEWRPLFPADGIFDEAAEAFDANIAALVPAGSHIIARARLRHGRQHGEPGRRGQVGSPGWPSATRPRQSSHAGAPRRRAGSAPRARAGRDPADLRGNLSFRPLGTFCG